MPSRNTRSGLGGDGEPWRISLEGYGDRDNLPRDVISRKLSVPNAERIFFIRHARRAGFTIEKIFSLTKIDRWFLTQRAEIVDFGKELTTTKTNQSPCPFNSIVPGQSAQRCADDVVEFHVRHNRSRQTSPNAAEVAVYLSHA